MGLMVVMVTIVFVMVIVELRKSIQQKQCSFPPSSRPPLQLHLGSLASSGNFRDVFLTILRPAKPPHLDELANYGDKRVSLDNGMRGNPIIKRISPRLVPEQQTPVIRKIR